MQLALIRQTPCFLPVRLEGPWGCAGWDGAGQGSLGTDLGKLGALAPQHSSPGLARGCPPPSLYGTKAWRKIIAAEINLYPQSFGLF